MLRMADVVEWNSIASLAGDLGVSCHYSAATGPVVELSGRAVVDAVVATGRAAVAPVTLVAPAAAAAADWTHMMNFALDSVDFAVMGLAEL